MCATDLHPTILSLLNGLFGPDQAGAVLEEVLMSSPRDSTRAYNMLLNACAKARRWEHAQRLFQVSWAQAACEVRAVVVVLVVVLVTRQMLTTTLNHALAANCSSER